MKTGLYIVIFFFLFILVTFIHIFFVDIKQLHTMLEVPDYSKIFDKYYDVLRDKIIRYAKGNLEGVPKFFTERYNHDDPNCNIEDSIQDFCGSELRDILPKMHSERIALENDVVGEDEEEAWDSGFWGDCDEEWDYLMNDIIHNIVEMEKLP